MTTYPHIMRIHENRVDYFDRQGGKAWLAVFEDVYKDHISVYLMHPRGITTQNIHVKKYLHTADDYKEILINMGVYEIVP